MHLLRRPVTRAITALPALRAAHTRSRIASLKTPFPTRASAKILAWNVQSSAVRAFATSRPCKEEEPLEKEAQELEEFASEEPGSASEELESALEEPESALEEPESASEELESASEELESASEEPESAPAVARGTYALRPQAPASAVLYVGNLSFDTQEDTVREWIEPFGEVKEVHLVRDGRGLSKGYGFVTMNSTPTALKVKEALDNTALDGRQLRLAFSLNRKQRLDRAPEHAPSRTLFIGNLPFAMSDSDLNDLFRDVQNVVDVRVAADLQTGQPKGFVHADFIDQDSAQDAVQQLRGRMMGGRMLRIDFAANAKGEGGRRSAARG